MARHRWCFGITNSAMNDVDRVGGKNASLGEMITNLSGMGVSVPNGFATTADAFNQFLDQSGVNQRIYETAG
ncbi:phosphoenolpyruvate synthase [Escherichia coli]|nr:phosphoenolpyruvate synthase [Escherichia coli]